MLSVASTPYSWPASASSAGAAVTLGQVKLNKEKCTARLTVSVPNPGELTGSGKGVKVAGAAKITFTPAGGDPSTQSKKLRLKKL